MQLKLNTKLNVGSKLKGKTKVKHWLNKEKRWKLIKNN